MIDRWMVTNLFSFMAYLSLVFPSGRLPSGGAWGRAARVGTAALTVAVLLPATRPPGTNLVSDVVSESGFAIAVVILLVAVVSLVVRWRRSEGDLRIQLAWILAAFALLVVLTVAANIAVAVLGADERVYGLAGLGLTEWWPPSW